MNKQESHAPNLKKKKKNLYIIREYDIYLLRRRCMVGGWNHRGILVRIGFVGSVGGIRAAPRPYLIAPL
jgi:hypothetical protein